MKDAAKNFELISDIDGYSVSLTNLLKINIASKLWFHQLWLGKSGLSGLNFAVEDNISNLDAFQNLNLFGPPYLQDLDILDFDL